MIPIVVSTWSFGQRGNAAAWPTLSMGGSSLDAVEAASAAVDADPTVDSVGFGGLPDASGRVTLDGCVMLSPASCGSVCATARHLHPVTVARRVMERTPHIMLAGEGADQFAESVGLSHDELLSQDARARWNTWREAPAIVDQSRDRLALRPVDQTGTGQLFNHGEGSHDEARWRHHDTIGVLALDSDGVLAGACSTSGTPFKLPGRVGDSPIIGHGLYVEPKIGAATATGTGELVMSVCGSFLAVERLRSGEDPAEAIRIVLERILEHHTLRASDQVGMLVLTPDGRWAAGALRGGFKVAVRTPEEDLVADPSLVLRDD